MSIATVHSFADVGLSAIEVSIEVSKNNGLPFIGLVGLAETSVRESKERVRAALSNIELKIPPARIMINLAPADLPKQGSRYDLGIAIAIIQACGLLPLERLDKYIFIGEVGLTGEIRSLTSVLPSIIEARAQNKTIILPIANLTEASRIKGVNAYGAKHLLEVVNFLSPIDNYEQSLTAVSMPAPTNDTTDELDFADVRGQLQAKRALEIAASGRHNVLLIGPPGAGKSMLAQRYTTILPKLNEDEAIESATIHSVAGLPRTTNDWYNAPYQAPHHSSSSVAIVGGGTKPKPGAISLAHNGVLFLDELPEFQRAALEMLREPLESNHVLIARAALQMSFPANFNLIAAMNPTPSGYFLDDSKNRCRDTQDQIRRYRNKISGPLLDRIDIHLEVPELNINEISGIKQEFAETSTTVRQRVIATRKVQLARQNKLNSELNTKEIEKIVNLDERGVNLIAQAMHKLSLSARAYHRILKLSRTIADMVNEENVHITHVAEAIGYRKLDR